METNSHFQNEINAHSCELLVEQIMFKFIWLELMAPTPHKTGI